MASESDLLSRKELIALWTEMAESFGSTLELPINNGISLVMKFHFNNDFGETEIKISDLAGAGSKWSGDPSQISTSVTTILNNELDYQFKIVLPPLFSSLLQSLMKDAAIIRTKSQKYWLRCKSRQIRQRLVESDRIQSLDQFRNFFARGREGRIETKTTSFLGRKIQITKFIEYHLDLLRLVA